MQSDTTQGLHLSSLGSRTSLQKKLSREFYNFLSCTWMAASNLCARENFAYTGLPLIMSVTMLAQGAYFDALAC